jgi:hypothetical protein
MRIIFFLFWNCLSSPLLFDFWLSSNYSYRCYRQEMSKRIDVRRRQLASIIWQEWLESLSSQWLHCQYIHQPTQSNSRGVYQIHQRWGWHDYNMRTWLDIKASHVIIACRLTMHDHVFPPQVRPRVLCPRYFAHSSSLLPGVGPGGTLPLTSILVEWKERKMKNRSGTSRDRACYARRFHTLIMVWTLKTNTPNNQ